MCHLVSRGRAAPVCLVLAVLAAGCGGATRGRGSARASSDTALALVIGYDKPDIVRVEVEETYPEQAWKMAKETEGQFAYRKMTDGVVWDWALLDELAAARAGAVESGAPAKVKGRRKPKRGEERARKAEAKAKEKAERRSKGKAEHEKRAEAEKKKEKQEIKEEPGTIEKAKEPKEEPKKRRRKRSRK